MSSELIVHTSDENFDSDVIKSDKPVLLDFWADWCGPCKMIAPLLDTIAEDYKDRLKIVKLNIDEHQKIAPKYNVRSIPTLLIIKDGEVAGQQIGAVSKAQLTKLIEETI